MRIECVAFTSNGVQLGLRLISFLQQEGNLCRLSAPLKYVKKDVDPLDSLAEWTASAFEKADALIFIGACGIAVRSIAPYLKSKFHEPAVVAIDDCNRFAVPLVSGHIGGANSLAEKIAFAVGAQAVVTTATDRNGVFAVDTWAAKQDFCVMRPEAAKAVSAAILNGDPVGFYSDFPLEGELPAGVVKKSKGAVGIRIALSYEANFEQTCWLLPRILTLGIGCKRGTSRETIEKAVRYSVQGKSLYMESVRNVASIDKKGDEIGIFEYCKANRLFSRFFTAEQLLQVKGAFTSSAFVQNTVGVGNVCERAAVLASGGTLLVRKTAFSGVTVAVAAAPLVVRF